MSGTPAEKLAALNERLKGTALLTLLNIKNKPAPEALVARIGELREVVYGLCKLLPETDPVRVTALERMKGAEMLLQDPLEWHILTRAQELRQDPTVPHVRALIETAFYDEHVPRTVWSSALPPDGAQGDLRRSLRLPVLMDVELDVSGKKVHCQTMNVSRDGLCVEVPAGFTAAHVPMILHLAATGVNINVSGDVVWRDAGRVGIAFKIAGVQEQNALDAALQMHFTSLQHTVERWREIAPKSGNAIACAAIVGYASSALPSTRREHLEKLAAAADLDRTSKDLQLALAKLYIEERNFDGAATALKRVVIGDRADPRYRLLELTLAQRSGRGGTGVGARLRSLVSAARVPLIALFGLALCVAGTFAVLAMHGPYASIKAPIGGLSCEQMKLLDVNALCFVDAASYKHLSPVDRAHLADKTLDGLRPRGVTQVTVLGTHEEGVLDMFDELYLRPFRKMR